MFSVEQWFSKVYGREMNLTEDFRKLHVRSDCRETSVQDRRSLWSSQRDCFCVSINGPGIMPRDLHLIRKVIWFRVFANWIEISSL
jgi:hypothetical protein